MNNHYYILSKYEMRNKTTIVNIILISLIMFVTVILSTYNNSLKEYMKNDIYNSFYYKSLTVTGNNNESLDDMRNELHQINHVSNVSLMVTYRNMLYSKNLETKKLDGNIEIYAANNNTIPKIIYGTDFPDLEENYIICPEHFYPTSNTEDLKYYSKKDKYDIKKDLNKMISFDYYGNLNNNGKRDSYSIQLKLIGVYKNNNSFIDENICYVSENVLSEIANNQYKNDIDLNTNENTINYQRDFVIEIDDLNNLDNVKESLNNKGYNYEAMALIVPDFIDSINQKVHYFNIMIYVVLLIIILFLLLKKLREGNEYYGLLNYLGYDKQKIRRIIFLGNLLNIFISIIISTIICFILLYLFQFILNYFPFLFNKWKLVFDYSPIIILSILIIIINIIVSFLHEGNHA